MAMYVRAVKIAEAAAYRRGIHRDAENGAFPEAMRFQS